MHNPIKVVNPSIHPFAADLPPLPTLKRKA